MSPLLGYSAFPMDGIGSLGHNPPRGPSADWWVLTTADAAETNGLTCLPKHGGARDTFPGFVVRIKLLFNLSSYLRKTFERLLKSLSKHQKLACGLRTEEEPRAWSTKACEVRVPESTHVACRCRGLGTYALFTIARSTLTDVEKDLRGVVKVTGSLSECMCLAAAALQLLQLSSGAGKQGCQCF
ncbi:hypothetical protein evm_001360 [Chilo suppressalis]|nr:hypothetical protein evm_001360 [Chilo suppressalis]